MPSDGNDLEQLALRPLDRLERADPRQVHGWTAVTTPIDGGAIAARSAISPETYMPISSTAASSSGPSRSQRQRQADLVVLVALRLERPQRAAQDGRDRFLRRGLGDAARDPDDERVEPPPPAGGDRTEPGQGVGDPHDRDVAERHRDRRCRRVTSRAAAPRSTASRRMEVAVGPLARQRHEQVARGRPDASRRRRRGSVGPNGRCSRPPVAADEIVGREDGRGVGGVELDGSTSLTAASVAQRRLTGPSRGWAPRPTGRSSRSGVVIASVAMRRKSSNDMTGISR